MTQKFEFAVFTDEERDGRDPVRTVQVYDNTKNPPLYLGDVVAVLPTGAVKSTLPKGIRGKSAIKKVVDETRFEDEDDVYETLMEDVNKVKAFS